MVTSAGYKPDNGASRSSMVAKRLLRSGTLGQALQARNCWVCPSATCQPRELCSNIVMIVESKSSCTDIRSKSVTIFILEHSLRTMPMVTERGRALLSPVGKQFFEGIGSISLKIIRSRTFDLSKINSDNVALWLVGRHLQHSCHNWFCGLLCPLAHGLKERDSDTALTVER